MKILKIVLPLFLVTLTFCSNSGKNINTEQSPWQKNFSFIYDIPAITFHYDHGILAGSYKPGVETINVSLDDVSRYLGHVCLCGAGGYKISRIAENLLKQNGAPLERGDFTLISSRDHTVSDVIAYVLGCTRRKNQENNGYFIDENIEAPRREYHYTIAYHPLKTAVHIIYRKHLLIGHEQMDRLWKIELNFEENPASVSEPDIKLYQDYMVRMVKKVLTDDKSGLFEVKIIDYNEFVSRLEKLKSQKL